MYSETVRDHAVNPRNRGVLENPDAVGSAFYRRCGDKMTLFFKIEEGVIRKAQFTVFGCGPTVAAASFATTFLVDQSVDRARQLDAFQLDQALGGLPVSKRHAILLVLQCLVEALGPRIQKT